MRHSTVTLAITISIAFAAGLLLSPLAEHAVSDAQAQTSAVTPTMIDPASIKHGDLPATPNPEMNTRMLATDNATIQLRSGNVGKHTHRPKQPPDDTVFAN